MEIRRRVLAAVGLFALGCVGYKARIVTIHSPTTCQLGGGNCQQSCSPGFWNVREGPVPPGTATVVGDGSDEMVGLQAILDAAPPGSVVYFPPGEYGVTHQNTV